MNLEGFIGEKGEELLGLVQVDPLLSYRLHLLHQAQRVVRHWQAWLILILFLQREKDRKRDR
jgi:hypothetical protein